ncbi:hypothetical protein GGQ92_002285 [Gracilibacillus halotolerans]|uniref:Uncharacterized protein n=1 Tax=Gracilibacillus halotolerans TaxID=74386 RepID=A0A841RPC1_9BACI|nr:hypothetical protein [Gracilibacillus halotolerans]
MVELFPFVLNNRCIPQWLIDDMCNLLTNLNKEIIKLNLDTFYK